MKSYFIQFLHKIRLFLRSKRFCNFDFKFDQIKFKRYISLEIGFLWFFLFIFYADLSEYRIIADIRTNTSGRQNLFHDGFKYCRDGSGTTRQRWVCTSKGGKKCKSSVSTAEIDGVTMMKVFNGEHTHDPMPTQSGDFN